jgi:hypothetical protein
VDEVSAAGNEAIVSGAAGTAGEGIAATEMIGEIETTVANAKTIAIPSRWINQVDALCQRVAVAR